jgi:hypothetical protein
MVRTNDCERNLASNFLGLSKSFLIFILIAGCLEDVDVVVINVCEDLRTRSGNMKCVTGQTIYPSFEGNDFLVRQRVGFGDDWDEVNSGVQATHKFNVELFQPIQRQNMSDRSTTEDNKITYE